MKEKEQRTTVQRENFCFRTKGKLEKNCVLLFGNFFCVFLKMRKKRLKLFEVFNIIKAKHIDMRVKLLFYGDLPRRQGKMSNIVTSTKIV
jgi:hypothetical protein